MHCVLFNGPPGSGKDTAAQLLGDLADTLDNDPLNPFTTMDWNFLHLKFSDPLKRATHELFGETMKDHGYFEELKNERLPQFFGFTPRECYIALSEKFAKPNYGSGFFGRLMIKGMEALNCFGSPNTFVAISDSGFEPELRPVLEHSGQDDHFLLVRMHRDGKDFTGDSRGYVQLRREDELPLEGKEPEYLSRLKEVDLINNGTLEELQDKLKEIITRWVSETSLS